MSDKKSVVELEAAKEKKIKETVAWRAGFYRCNPQRFVADFLQIKLRTFQSILIYAMMHNHYFMMIAARGMGKTFLTALFCCVRCILFPGTKIVVCSGTLKQAKEVLLKIREELMPMSPMLRNEIEDVKITLNENIITFKGGSKGGSWIQAVTATETARGKRANILILDEFRLIPKPMVDLIFRKFLSNPRQPKYLDNPKYAHLLERNKEIYLTSAYFKSSWAWDKLKAYVVNFFNDKKKYFVCGLPYQLSIKEGLLMREQVEDEMSDMDFNEIAFEMEMGCMWIGESGDSLFKFDIVDSCRVLSSAFPTLGEGKIPPVKLGNKRILSLDVALMRSTSRRKNDASAFWINDLERVDNTSYHSNYRYCESFEGLTTDELGIIAMRYFYEYGCTDFVLDTQGLGIGVADFIVKDQYDKVTGKTYKALTFINSDDMACRCKVPDANKVVWSVKASEAFNNRICVMLRNALQNKRISLLKSETYIEEMVKNYSKLEPMKQALVKKPYLNTTFGVYELAKLDHEYKNNYIKVKQVDGMRKDRYSSLAYNNWVVDQLETQLKPQKEKNKDKKKLFSFRAPRSVKRF